jgi:hypothetical protein
MPLFSRFRDVWAGLLLAMPITAFWVFWARLAVNVPKWDDFGLRSFVVRLSHENTFSTRFYEFWRPHNEHRIMLDRLLTWADVRVFGVLDYTHLMLAGNLALAGLLLVFGRVLVRAGRWWGEVVPVAFLLFNLSHWENMFWGMAAPQNLGVVLWTVGCLYALSFTKSATAALLLAVLATITSTNGLLVWPLGAGLLVLQSRWRLLAVWLVVAAGLMIAYFSNYEVYRHQFGDPLASATGFLAFLGAAAEAIPFGAAFQNCVALGAVLLLWAIWRGLRLLTRWPDRAKWSSADLFFIGMVGFLVATALAVVRARLSYGLEGLIASRYKIYSLTFLCLLYVDVQASRRRVATASGNDPLSVQALTGLWLGGVVAAALAYLSYPSHQVQAYHLRHTLITSQFNWTYTQNRPVATTNPVTAWFSRNTPAFYDTQLPTIFGTANSPVLVGDTLFRSGKDWVIEHKTNALPKAVGPDDGLYLRLRSAERTYLLATYPVPVGGLRARLSIERPAPWYHTLTIGPGDTAPGNYQLDWLRVDPTGACQLQPWGQTLTTTAPAIKQPVVNW